MHLEGWVPAAAAASGSSTRKGDTDLALIIRRGWDRGLGVGVSAGRIRRALDVVTPEVCGVTPLTSKVSDVTPHTFRP
jgi:hypothetical protein